MNSSAEVSGSIRRNLLLAALPAQSLAAISRDVQIEEVPLGRTIFEPEVTNDVLFPLDAVISMLREFEDGTAIEVATVGPEGMVGLNAMVGVPVNAHGAIVQGRGIVGRVKGSVLRAHVQRDEAMRDVFMRYTYAFAATASQLAACNRLHVVTERLAHWLLLLHDRIGADKMSLTQEFLAFMLGTRRAGINVAVRELEESGAIDHRRNLVTVVDRKKLEEQSCACYEMMIADYERALGFRPVARGRMTPVD